ncbi:hypothetical protein DC366_19410, partial [Pelagivirga sediminicola]
MKVTMNQKSSVVQFLKSVPQALTSDTMNTKNKLLSATMAGLMTTTMFGGLAAYAADSVELRRLQPRRRPPPTRPSRSYSKPPTRRSQR